MNWCWFQSWWIWPETRWNLVVSCDCFTIKAVAMKLFMKILMILASTVHFDSKRLVPESPVATATVKTTATEMKHELILPPIWVPWIIHLFTSRDKTDQWGEMIVQSGPINNFSKLKDDFFGRGTRPPKVEKLCSGGIQREHSSYMTF